ncbi:hypothetical protein BN1708_019566, partial [Verticillium longisporum]
RGHRRPVVGRLPRHAAPEPAQCNWPPPARPRDLPVPRDVGGRLARVQRRRAHHRAHARRAVRPAAAGEVARRL